MMKQIEDDLFTLTEQGNFDLIFHGVNCFCTAPYAGIAAEFEKRFNISLFGYEQDYYKGKFAKLGNVAADGSTVPQTRWRSADQVTPS